MQIIRCSKIGFLLLKQQLSNCLLKYSAKEKQKQKSS